MYVQNYCFPHSQIPVFRSSCSATWSFIICSGERNGNPLQYSCLENPMDNEAWQAIVHGIAKELWFSCSTVSNSATPWTAACQASLSFTISQSLLKLMSIESVMPSKHLILCRPLLLLPPIFHARRVI